MENRNKFEVYFAQTWSAKNKVKPGTIILIPSDNKWNNFGHKNHFDMWLDEYENGEALALAFQYGNGENAFLQVDNVVNKKLSEGGKKILPASEFPAYFTMLFEMDDYRKLINRHGVDEGNLILSSLNDLVHARRNCPQADWLSSATDSKAFNLSFMRNSQTMFAYYNAASLLSGLQYENLSAAEKSLGLSFELPGFENKHKFDFRFDFDEILPKQIAVVIGKNGVGKSRALSKIVEFALSSDDALHGDNGRRPMLGKIVAISTPGETYGTFPPPPPDARIRYERLLSERRHSREFIGNSLPEVLIQLAKIYDNQIAQNSRWELFEEAISDFCDISSLVIGHETNPSEDFVPVISLVRGGEQRSLEAMARMDKNGILMRNVPNAGVLPLSSGQVSFVRLAAQLCLTVENGTLILIDEPETHLHPNLITEFVGMLNKILGLTGSIAIVATHSTYMVREVPRSQVHVIQERERFVDVVTPRLKTFGADVGAISEFVFGDDVINRLVTEVEMRLRGNPQLRNGWKERLVKELSPEAVMYLIESLGGDKDSEEY